ncbi:hypothetical protein EYF80_029877 [Liparis tanakae]|uniref:Uncharacterized protein n=1 Tax=Liparis tanakae TaxID=230148 RepID=A0A4Z2H2U7_9TELE|nr:hypothetical protein EYF80_029877 [Liparis tanakae]
MDPPWELLKPFPALKFHDREESNKTPHFPEAVQKHERSPHCDPAAESPRWGVRSHQRRRPLFSHAVQTLFPINLKGGFSDDLDHHLLPNPGVRGVLVVGGRCYTVYVVLVVQYVSFPLAGRSLSIDSVSQFTFISSHVPIPSAGRSKLSHDLQKRLTNLEVQPGEQLPRLGALVPCGPSPLSGSGPPLRGNRQARVTAGRRSSVTAAGAAGAPSTPSTPPPPTLHPVLADTGSSVNEVELLRAKAPDKADVYLPPSGLILGRPWRTTHRRKDGEGRIFSPPFNKLPTIHTYLESTENAKTSASNSIPYCSFIMVTIPQEDRSAHHVVVSMLGLQHENNLLQVLQLQSRLLAVAFMASN